MEDESTTNQWEKEGNRTRPTRGTASLETRWVLENNREHRDSTDALFETEVDAGGGREDEFRRTFVCNVRVAIAQGRGARIRKQTK